MAVSQGWSDWVDGWFELGGKIIRVIATAVPSSGIAARQLTAGPRAGSRGTVWKHRYHNTAILTAPGNPTKALTKAWLSKQQRQSPSLDWPQWKSGFAPF
jgi:hypothetical protein